METQADEIAASIRPEIRAGEFSNDEFRRFIELLQTHVVRTTRPPYPADFREQIVALVRAGRTPEELAREYEPTEPTIWSWVAQADRDQGVRADGVTSAEKEELRRLRRENKVLRQEKEILKKAAAWFARESSSIPERDSSS